MKTLGGLYDGAVDILLRGGIENPAFDAMCLLEECFDVSRSQYFLRKEEPVLKDKAERYMLWVARRAAREPLQYILGKWDFYKYTFFVGDGVLIPRPETESLVERAVKEICANNYKVCFDLCAGSGCIGLSVAKECPGVQVWMFEKYSGAFEYLKKNADLFSLDNAHIFRYDIFNGLDPSFMPNADIILSNPPYICTNEISILQEEVKKEPQSALDGGGDGLDFYHCIEEHWFRRIAGIKAAILEAGEGQAYDISEIFKAYDSEIFKDSFGVERFIFVNNSLCEGD